MTTILTSENGISSRSRGAYGGKNLVEQLTDGNFWRGWQPKGRSPEEVQIQWQKCLVKRWGVRSPKGSLPAQSFTLDWGIESSSLAPYTQQLFHALRRLNQNPMEVKRGGHESLLEQFTTSADTEQISIDFALQSLAIVQLLARAAEHLAVTSWWDVLGRIAQSLDQCDFWHIDLKQLGDQILAHQLFTGELRLALGYYFPEIRQFAKSRKTAIAVLEEGMDELLDEEGLPHARYITIFRPLMACWTRCSQMASAEKKEVWAKKCAPQFESAVTQSLILSSPLGSSLLAGEDTTSWTPEFLAAMLAAGGDAIDRTAAIDLLPKKQVQRIRGKSGPITREPSAESEWSALAIMRTEFSASAPVLALDYSQPSMQIEMWQGKQQLLIGEWKTQTELAGVPLKPVDSWQQTCWFSDEDVDYLELSISLERGARLDRQILLAREDLFLIFNDIVIGNGDPIQHTVQLPLGKKVIFAGEAETRDGYLLADKAAARVLPLALPEWRVDPRVGELLDHEHTLTLRQERHGRRMACPLFIDLDKSRFGKPCTWRQLTVASGLEIQNPDVAVGFRIQCHKEQWLMYRSLDAPANRTVLGQNLSDEFLIARFFAPTGDVEELLQIEN